MQRIARVFVLVLLFLATTIAMTKAEEYYVSSDIGVDNLSNDGQSWSESWASITFTLNQVSRGDIIYVDGNGDDNEYYEHVFITRNDLQIIGDDRNDAGGVPILKYGGWYGGSDPIVGFDVQADNITIRNFKIQDFVANSDGGDFANDGGVGVYVFNETSGHIFDQLQISNCTWGVYVREGAVTQILNSSIDLDNNGKVGGDGGTGIMVWTSVADIDLDAIYIGVEKDGSFTPASNTISNCPTNGIQYGRQGDDVNAEGSYIMHNLIKNCGSVAADETEGYGIAIWNLLGSVDISENTIGESPAGTNQNRGLYLSCVNIDESNNDVYVHDNQFYIEDEIIVAADEDYAGEVLYDIWWNNSNDFGGSVKHTAAALEGSINEIVASRTNSNNRRFIRYNIQDAIDDSFDDDRVMVSEGSFDECLDVPVSIELFSASELTILSGSQDKPIVTCSDDIVYGSSSSFTGVNNNPQHEFYAADIEYHGFEMRSSATTTEHMLGIAGQDNEIYNNWFKVPSRSSSTFSGMLSKGIVNRNIDADDDIGGLSVYNNWFTSSSTGGYGYEGIHLWSQRLTPAGDDISIESNSFTGEIYTGVVDERSNVDIVSNTMITDLTQSSNTIYDVGEGYAGVDLSNSSTLGMIDDVTIQCNTIGGNSGYIYGVVLGESVTSNTLTNVDVLSNSISNSHYGIANYANSSTMSVHVKYHDFADSDYSAAGQLAVFNSSTVTLDASNNWWDSDAGPLHDDNPFNKPSQTVGAEGEMIFTPWLASALNFGSDCLNASDLAETFGGPVYLYNSAETILRGEFPSIQSAVDAVAADGDHIIAKEGTYAEQVTVYEQVYLRGKKPGTPGTGIPDGTEDAWTNGTPGTGSGPVITYDGTLSDMVYFSEDNITMRGFNFDMSGAASKGIQFTGNLNNSTVEYCNFDMNTGDKGIEANNGNGVTGMDVNYNKFMTSSSSTFFGTTPNASTMTNISLANNNITGNSGIVLYFGAAQIDGFTATSNTFADGGILVGQPSSTTTGYIADFQIQNNWFLDGSNDEPALFIEKNIQASADLDDNDWSTDMVFWNNQVLDTDADPAVGFESSSYSVDAGDNLDARSNWWASTNGPSVKNDAPEYEYADLELNAYQYGDQGSMVTPGVDFVRWYDDASMSDLYGPIWNDDSPQEYYAALQFAYDGTAPGGVVTFDDGTFTVVTEKTVSSSLTINGQGYSATTVLDGSYKNGSIVNGGDRMFTIEANDVTFSGFKIDLGDDDTDFDVGIFKRDTYTDFTLEDNWMVYAEGGNAVGEQLVHIRPGDNSTVRNNLLEASSGNSTVYLSAQSSGNVVNRFTFEENEIQPYPTADGGVNSPYGAVINPINCGVTNSTISSNTFTQTAWVWLGAGSASPNRPTHDVTVSCNYFYDNVGYNYSGHELGAIVITSENDGVATYNIDVRQNYFSGAGADQSVGGAVTISDFDNTTADLSNISVNQNYFETDNYKAIVYENGAASDVIDADNNYYGDQYGPEHPDNAWGGISPHPGAEIDGASGTVSFVPFWTSISGDVCSYTGVEETPVARVDQESPIGATIDEYFASIDAAIQDAGTADGDFIWVKAGSFLEDAIDVNKEVTVVGKKSNFQTSAYTTGTPGFDAGPAVITDNTDDNIFNITANNVTLKGMKVKSMSDNTYGVKTANSATATWVMYNDFENNDASNVAFGFASSGIYTAFTGDYNNIYDASGSGSHFLEVPGGSEFDTFDFKHSLIDAASGTVTLGAADKSSMTFSYNEFGDDTDGRNGVLFTGGTTNPAGTFTDISLHNNIFSLPQGSYAVRIDDDLTDDEIAGADWYSNFVIENNSIDIVPNHEAVGFADASTSNPSNDVYAECNWWGADGGPEHSSNTKIGASTGSSVTDNVDFLPWLTDGSDAFPGDVGFQTVAACNGANVYTSTSFTWGDGIVGYYANIQDAIDNVTTDAGPAPYYGVHITSGSYDEDVDVNTGTNVGFVSNNSATIVDDVDYDGHLSITNSSTLTLYSSYSADGNLTLGASTSDCNNYVKLQDYDLYFGSNFLNLCPTKSNSYVMTNGTGFLRKFNATSGINYNFFIGTETEFTQTQIIVSNTNFNSILGIRVNDENPATAYEGQPSYAVNHTWFIEATKEDGSSYPSGFDFNADINFIDVSGYDAGVDFTFGSSYGARWDAPNDEWESWLLGSVPASNDLKVNAVSQLNTVWGVFSGNTSFALSNLPTPARYIMFLRPSNPDTEMKMRWINGDGDGVVAVIEESSTLTDNDDYPKDGTDYTGQDDNTTQSFGSGTSLVGGAEVLLRDVTDDPLYNPLMRMVTINSLDPGTEYSVGVFSFNGRNGLANYNTTIEGSPDPARRNPRSYTTYPRASMFISGGAATCAYSPPVDDCEIICDGGSIDLIFQMEGGLVGSVPNNAQFVYSTYSGSEQEFPTTYSSTYTQTPTVTQVYKLLRARDGNSKLALIDEDHDQVKVEVQEPAVVNITPTSPSTVCETSGTITINTEAAAGDPMPNFQRWEFSTDGGSSWATVDLNNANNAFGSAGCTASSSGSNPYTLTIWDLDADADTYQIRSVWENQSYCSPGYLADLTAEQSTLSIDEAPAAGTWVTTDFDFCEAEEIVLDVDNSSALFDNVTWEISTDGGSTFNDVSGGDFVTSNTSLTITSNETTYNDDYFRVKYENGTCTDGSPDDAAYTSPEQISVDEQPGVTAGPAIYPTGQHCDGDPITVWINVSTGSIQWYYDDEGDGVGITTAGTSASISTTANADDKYWAVITNGECSINSSTVTVSGAPAASIDETGMDDQTICEETDCGGGSDAVFPADITGVGSGTVTWHWGDGSNRYTFGTDPMPSGSYSTGGSSTLTICGADLDYADWDGKEIWVEASNGICITYSSTYTLYVKDKPIVNSSPSNSTICEGTTLQFVSSGSSNNCTPEQRWYTDAGGSVHALPDYPGGVDSPTGATISYFASDENYLQVDGASKADWDGADVWSAFTCSPCLSVNSATATATVNTVPSEPQNLLADFSGITYQNTSFHVEWDPPATGPVTDYEVKVDESGGSNIISWTSTSGNEYYDLSECDAAPNTSYDVYVRAKNDCGNGLSETTTITTQHPEVSATSNTLTDFGNVQVGTTSTFTRSTTVNLSELDYDVTITVPATYNSNVHFEYSVDGGSSWHTNNTFSGLSNPFTLDVRFKPQDAASNINANIEIEEAATCYPTAYIDHIDYVYVSGTGVPAKPDNQIIDINFTENSSNYFEFEWDWNDGSVTAEGALIVMKQQTEPCSPSFTWTPTDNVDYTSSPYNVSDVDDGSNHGNWSDYSDGDYHVVGDIERSALTSSTGPIRVEGLSANTNYVVHLYAYKGSGSVKRYNTDHMCADFNPNGMFPLVFTSGPSSLEYSDSTFDSFTVARKDRAGNNYTPSASASVEVTPVDESTLNDVTSDYDGTGTVSNAAETIASSTYSVNFDSFVWNSDDDNRGRAFNELMAEADGYMTGYSETTYTDPNGTDHDGFVLRAKDLDTNKQALYIVGYGVDCQDDEGYLKLRYRPGFGSNYNGTIIVMRNNNTPNVPNDGEWYDPGSTENDGNYTNIPFDQCDQVEASHSRAVFNEGTGTYLTEWIGELDDDTYYWFKASHYSHNDNLSGDAKAATVNYLESLGSFNPNSKQIPSCRITAGGIFVELDHFTPDSYERKAYLDWVTTFEQSIVGYELYRANIDEQNSSAKAEYTKIASYQSDDNMIAQGELNNEYRFVDEDNILQVGQEYMYKLAAVGIDGQRIKLSEKPLMILSRPSEIGDLYVSEIKPVPASDKIEFNLELQKAQNLTIEVLDMSGRIVSTPVVGKSYNAGNYPVKVDLGDVASGTYVLNVKSDSDVIIRKFIVAK